MAGSSTVHRVLKVFFNRFLGILHYPKSLSVFKIFKVVTGTSDALFSIGNLRLRFDAAVVLASESNGGGGW